MPATAKQLQALAVGRAGNHARGTPYRAKVLRGINLTPRQRRVLNQLIEGQPTGLTEVERSEVIAQIIHAVERAGRGEELLDVLGLDMISIALSLRDCMRNATRPGGRDVGEVRDYATRHMTDRTALELRKRIGPRRGIKDKVPPPPPDRARGRKAIALLGDAPEVTAPETTPDVNK